MKYDLSLFDRMKFDPTPAPSEKAVGMLTPAQEKGLPSGNEDYSELKGRLAYYFEERLEGAYNMVEACCDIGREAFSKYIRPSSNRLIPAVALAKFCVGARLSPEIAEKLFSLSGRCLRPLYVPFDFILMCELENGGDLWDFERDLVSHGLPGVLSDENKIHTDDLFDMP